MLVELIVTFSIVTNENDTGTIAVVIADAMTSIIIVKDDNDDDVNDVQGGLEMQMASASMMNLETSLSFLFEGEEGKRIVYGERIC